MVQTVGESKVLQNNFEDPSEPQVTSHRAKINSIAKCEGQFVQRLTGIHVELLVCPNLMHNGIFEIPKNLKVPFCFSSSTQVMVSCVKSRVNTTGAA